MNEKIVSILQHKLPWSDRVFLVAEISGNHCGSFYKAKQLICAARESGADAVKVQIFEPDDLTLKCFDIYKLYQAIQTPLIWLAELKELADKIGIVFFGTVYHPSKIPFCEQLGIPIYKISSFETSFRPLLKLVSELNKPVIVSTGQSPYNEIKEIVETVGRNKLCILKCTSKYPAKIEELNIRTILHIRKKLNVDVGLSDHTDGILAPVVAVSLGARVIEKHLCLDKNCPEGLFAIMPDRFDSMVQIIRGAETALGRVWYGRKDGFKRSWAATKSIKKDELLDDNNTSFVRTIEKGKNLRGEKATKDYKYGDLLQEIVNYRSENGLLTDGRHGFAGATISTDNRENTQDNSIQSGRTETVPDGAGVSRKGLA